MQYWADLQSVHGLCYGSITRTRNVSEYMLVLTLSLVIIRPHGITTYVDAAYSYRLSSVVCRSVCHTSEPCKNGCTDRAAVWVEDLDGPGEPCIRWGPDPTMGRGKFLGENGRPIVKYGDTLQSSVQRRLNR